MRILFIFFITAFTAISAAASISNSMPAEPPIEIHQRIMRDDVGSHIGSHLGSTAPPAASPIAPPIAHPVAALTLDACGGQYDADLIRLLVTNHVPATIFITKKWIDRNPAGLRDLLAHPELFELENHGVEHIPAVIGAHRRVYGILGEPDIAHLYHEVEDAAVDIRALTHRNVNWYRGATAEYDRAAIEEIEKMGYKIAGFSVNADAGATLKRATIAARLFHIADGDIIIAHMNKPRGDTAEGISDALPTLLARGFQFVTLNNVRVHEIR